MFIYSEYHEIPDNRVERKRVDFMRFRILLSSENRIRAGAGYDAIF